MPYPEDVAPVVDAIPADAPVVGEEDKVVDERHHKRPQYGSQSGNFCIL